MKVKDIINSDLIESDMYVIIRRADSFCAIAEGEQREDGIIKYYDREVSAFTWQDDRQLYIDLK